MDKKRDSFARLRLDFGRHLQYGTRGFGTLVEHQLKFGAPLAQASPMSWAGRTTTQET